jgi:hypothetical protein
MSKMNDEEREELIKDITECATNPDTKIFLTIALTDTGDLIQRGYINGANPLHMAAMIKSLLEIAADRAQEVGGPYTDMVPLLQKLIKATDLSNLLAMLMLARSRDESNEPGDESNEPGDDKPFDFDFDIPGGK